MPDRLGGRRIAGIVGLAALTLGTCLGGSSRLTYHEAIVAEEAREMLAGGDLLVPTIGGRPWLEKPPLAVWLVALVGRVIGGVDEVVARTPSAVAAALLAVGVANLAARRFGREVGWLAGAVQATTAWTVIRGRLAEADVILASLIVWAIVAFDRMRSETEDGPWRWAFFGLLGATALAKGIGFGGALVVATAALVVAWDRDWGTLRRLASVGGWALAGLLALAWPALVLTRYPEALRLWTMHMADRLAAHPEHFAGEPWWQYAPSPLWQVLPWTPLALLGVRESWRRALRERGGPDRLLWAWAIGPAALVSLATVKNGHYLIYALPPWSIWAALGLVRLRERGWRLRAVLPVVGLAWALGFGLLGPRLDRRGEEWAFYEVAARHLRAGEPLVLLYDDWDRKPYPTPFGPFPHDLPVRLFYLDRPAEWRSSPDELREHPPAPPSIPFAVIGRDRDVPALRRLGRVETVARGPGPRWDRTFALYRITPEADRLTSRDDLAPPPHR